jgi:hypothetical protein
MGVTVELSSQLLVPADFSPGISLGGPWSWCGHSGEKKKYFFFMAGI